MRTQIVTAEDRRLTKVSADIAADLESHGYWLLQKRYPGYVGSHAQSIHPVNSDTERRLVEERKPLSDEKERHVMQLRQDIANREVLLASGWEQNARAIQEANARDRQLLSVLTAVPQFTDQIGRIR